MAQHLHVDDVIAAIVANHLHQKKYAKTLSAFREESGFDSTLDLSSSSKLASILGANRLHRRCVAVDSNISVLSTLAHVVLNMKRSSSLSMYSLTKRRSLKNVRRVTFDVDDSSGTQKHEQLVFDPRFPVNRLMTNKRTCIVRHTKAVRRLLSVCRYERVS